MLNVRKVMMLAPLFVGGCVVYDEQINGDLRETGTYEEEFDWEITETASSDDQLAWFEPNFAVVGIMEIIGLYGDFEPEEVESVSLSGPGQISILTSTIRDDEYLLTIDLSKKSAKAGSYNAYIWFTDGSAFYIPSVFEAISEPEQTSTGI